MTDQASRRPPPPAARPSAPPPLSAPPPSREPVSSSPPPPAELPDAELVAAEFVPAAPGPAPPLIERVVSVGGEPEPLFRGMPLEAFVGRRREPRPLLGVSLWCFGALFWSYLVVGELVIWTAVPEVMGVLAVMLAFGIAWYRGTSQMPRLPQWRWLLPGIIGFFSWVVTLLLSSAVFSTGGRSQAEMAALFLWSVAASAYALGRHLTALTPLPMSPRARAGRIALWLLAGIATLLSCVNILSYS